MFIYSVKFLALLFSDYSSRLFCLSGILHILEGKCNVGQQKGIAKICPSFIAYIEFKGL